jgi:hypothetical protein
MMNWEGYVYYKILSAFRVKGWREPWKICQNIQSQSRELKAGSSEDCHMMRFWIDKWI